MKHAFVGDVLFAGSIGRTDFPQGDSDTFARSITTRLCRSATRCASRRGTGRRARSATAWRTNPSVGGT